MAPGLVVTAIGVFTPLLVAVAVTAPMPFDWTSKENVPLALVRLVALTSTVPVWVSVGASVHFCVADGWRM